MAVQLRESLGATSIRKFLRYVRLYGLARTYYKIAARTRSRRLPRLPTLRRRKSIAVIGCGQFAFASIGYFLSRRAGDCIATCYDIDESAAATFQRFFRVPLRARTLEDAITDDRIKVVFIASNHATHAEYAAIALDHGKTVYVEKPVAVTCAQLRRLTSAVQRHPHAIYAGYNRPFSQAMRDLRQLCPADPSPLTISCFVSGHRITADHWYRNPSEGTRVCGNIGHWLDLLVHILCWGELPDEWNVTVVWSNHTARDDDLAITLTSARGDLASIVLTARAEPFEGINECIAIQWGNCIAKIDDFRTMTVWLGQNKTRRRYWPKDVGHEQAILQPWSKPYRQWSEIENSTLLMLKIADMVRASVRTSRFSFSEMRSSLDNASTG